ncbi:MAG: hypothetical protein RL322_15, partial [Pseudomonadota bacterium]
PINWAFLDAVRFALQMPDQIRSLGSIGSTLPLGSLYNLGRSDFKFASALLNTGPGSDSAVLGQLNTEANKLATKASGGVQATGRSGLVFMPYLLDIGNWAKMFSGSNATLFTYELPLFNLDFSFDQDLVRIPVPFPPASFLKITIGAFGSIRGIVDLAFGYDTFGIQQFMQTDNLMDVRNGFYISDYTMPLLRDGKLVPGTGGKEKPEFSLNLTLGLRGSLDAKLFEGGVKGQVSAAVSADLSDLATATVVRDANGQVTSALFAGDGKIRASELVSMLQYQGGGALNLFNIDASLGVSASAFGRIGVWPLEYSDEKVLFDRTLYSLAYRAPVVQPLLGSVSNGVLTLYAGPSSSSRAYIDTTDTGETWKLSGSGGKVQVEFAGKYYREFTGVNRIDVNLGEGNDSFDASRLRDVKVAAKGGAGDDTIVLGAAGGSAFDDQGDNTLKALETSPAPVTLVGGDGNDSVTGGAGADMLFAGSGTNLVNGGGGDDQLFALEGGNRLTGGDGIDRYVFIGALGANRMIEKGDQPSILDFSGVLPTEFASLAGPVVGAPTVSIPSGFTAMRGGPAQLLLRGTPFRFDGPADKLLTVTLRVPDGVISASTQGGVTVAGSNIERTFTGTVANLNTFFTTPGRVLYNYTSGEATRPLSIEVANDLLTSTAQATITATLLLDQVRAWRDVAVSASRQVAIASPSAASAASTQGGLWVSTDGGATWTESAAPKDRQYSAVAISADGLRIVAAVTGGGLLASTDGGATWRDPGAPSDAYTDVTILADGRVIASDRAIREQYVNSPRDKGWRNTTGTVRISDAQLGNWVATALPNANWSEVASSADGRVTIAVSGTSELGTVPGTVWIGRAAASGGALTWAASTGGLPANANWSAAAIDPSGTRAYIANRGGTIYSADLTKPTITWQSTGLASSDWSSLAFSANGQSVVAATSGLGKSGLWLLEGTSGWRQISTVGLSPLGSGGKPVDVEWTGAVFNPSGNSIIAVASGNRVFTVHIPTSRAAPSLNAPTSLEAPAGMTSALTFEANSIVDADSNSVTLSLGLSNAAAGSILLDAAAVTAAGLARGGDSNVPTLTGSPTAISSFLTRPGAVRVALGSGAGDVSLDLTVTDGVESNRTSVMLVATQLFASTSSYNGGALEIVDIGGSDLRLSRFNLSQTRLGPMNDELTIQRLIDPTLTLTASGGADRYV